MDINMPGIDGAETTKLIRDYLNENRFFQPFIVAHTAIPQD